MQADNKLAICTLERGNPPFVSGLGMNGASGPCFSEPGRTLIPIIVACFFCGQMCLLLLKNWLIVHFKSKSGFITDVLLTSML